MKTSIALVLGVVGFMTVLFEALDTRRGGPRDPANRRRGLIATVQLKVSQIRMMEGAILLLAGVLVGVLMQDS